MEKRVDLLDHGYLQFVDNMGTDLSIVRSARVSYDGKGKSSDEKLINYLMTHGHNTPFESCVVTFEIKAPIFVVRQWHRHRTQSYNEISARYTELPEEVYVPVREQITEQSVENKQMKTDVQNPNWPEAQEVMEINAERAFQMYRDLIDMRVPRELARSVLPVGTYTRFFATANLHNWFKFINERSHPHAQYEIMVYSDAIWKMLEGLYPLATKAFGSIK